MAWVLFWKYGDGSACGVVRVYLNEKRAQEDFYLVKEDTSKIYELVQVPLFRGEIAF